MASQFIELPVKGSSGSGVTSLNSETGAITLVAGANITITPSGQNITIAAGDVDTAILSINSDSTAAQLLSIGTAGADFAIVDAGSGSHVFNLPVASASNTGKLSSTDWSTFNSKQSALTLGNLTDVGTDGITIGSGTGAVVGSGTTISQHVADASHNGYLSSADWSTFSAKQAAGNYITALTGDGTASGPGSVALTLATVNSNVGSFGDATHVSAITVNGKGLVTAAASTSIQIAESQVTNLTTDLAAKQSTTLTSAHILVGNGSNVATDVAMTGDVSITNAGVTTVVTVGGSTAANIHSAELTANIANSVLVTSTGAWLYSYPWNLIPGLYVAGSAGASSPSGQQTFTATRGVGITQFDYNEPSQNNNLGPGSWLTTLSLDNINFVTGSVNPIFFQCTSFSMPNLVQVGVNFSVAANNTINTLSVPNLVTVGGIFSGGGSSPTNLNSVDISSLKEVGSNFSLWASVVNWTFNTLQNVGNDFSPTGSAATTVSFTGLKYVGENFTPTFANASLGTMNFSGLIYIEAQFIPASFVGTGMNFSALTTVGGKIDLEGSSTNTTVLTLTNLTNQGAN